MCTTLVRYADVAGTAGTTARPRHGQPASHQQERPRVHLHAASGGAVLQRPADHAGRHQVHVHEADGARHRHRHGLLLHARQRRARLPGREVEDPSGYHDDGQHDHVPPDRARRRLPVQDGAPDHLPGAGRHADEAGETTAPWRRPTPAARSSCSRTRRAARSSWRSTRTTTRRSACAGTSPRSVFTIGVQSTQAALEIQAGQLDFNTSNLATADIIKISQNQALQSQVHSSSTPGHHLPVPEQRGAAAQQRRRPQGDQLRDQPDGDRGAVGRPAGRDADATRSVRRRSSDYKKYTIYPNTPEPGQGEEAHGGVGREDSGHAALRTQNDAPGFMNMAAVIQSNLKAIGINVQIVGTPNSVNSSFIVNPKATRSDGDRAVVARLPRRARPSSTPAWTRRRRTRRRTSARFGVASFIPPFNPGRRGPRAASG